MKETIKRIITVDLLGGTEVDSIRDTTSLFDELELDSIQLLQLIALLEKNFQIQFTGNDLVLDNFENIERIAELINSKKGN